MPPLLLGAAAMLLLAAFGGAGGSSSKKKSPPPVDPLVDAAKKARAYIDANPSEGAHVAELVDLARQKGREDVVDVLDAPAAKPTIPFRTGGPAAKPRIPLGRS